MRRPHHRSRAYTISAKSRVGRLRRCIKRAFIASNNRLLTTTQILARGYPRLQRIPCGHRWGLTQALRREATAIARMRFGRGRPCLWARK
jgi:hypothetical protein